ncbi:MAG: RNA polymerase sigma factor [Saprospiraceae bacterium]
MSTEQFKKDILPFQNKLYRYALSIVFDAELAKDIVQEVFLKVWTKRAELASVNNKEAWCIRITRNLALDKLKAASRKNVDLAYAANHFVGDANPAIQTEENDLIASIYEAMKDLSPQQKEIFRLRDLLGYTNKEIKELMDLKDSQVKVNLYRARQKIKAKLGKLINYGS